MKPGVNLADWQSVENLLTEWYHAASVNRDLNAGKAQWNRKLHLWLGVPVVIFSSIVGSATFSQIHNTSGSNPVRYTAGLLSIVSAVLARPANIFWVWCPG